LRTPPRYLGMFVNLAATVASALALFAPASAHAGCGYCVTPSECDQRPSRYNCRVLFRVGDDGPSACNLSYSKVCQIANPLRVGGDPNEAPDRSKNLEDVAEVEKSENGVVQAVFLRVPIDELPVTINVSNEQYRAIAVANPHAAMGLLHIMNEGKLKDDPTFQITFSYRPLTTEAALELWTAALTKSSVSAAKSNRKEVTQISMERTLAANGFLVIDFEIVHKTEALVEIGKSFFQLRLAPAYTVLPSRPVYNISTWRVGASRNLTDVE
jgi:hypothetical protein